MAPPAAGVTLAPAGLFPSLSILLGVGWGGEVRKGQSLLTFSGKDNTQWTLAGKSSGLSPWKALGGERPVPWTTPPSQEALQAEGKKAHVRAHSVIKVKSQSPGAVVTWVGG